MHWGYIRRQFIELFQSSTAQMKTLSEQRIGFMLALRSSPDTSPVTLATVDKLTRHVRVFGKFFRRLQQLEPAKFVELPTCNGMVLYYWEKVVQATNGPPDMIKGRIQASIIRSTAHSIALRIRFFRGRLSRPLSCTGHGSIQGKSCKMDPIP